MATPAAAALFAAALPSRPEASSEASSSNHPFPAANLRGRGRGTASRRGRGRGERGGIGRDDDVGMADIGEPQLRRRGRDGRKSSGPMGERVSSFFDS